MKLAAQMQLGVALFAFQPIEQCPAEALPEWTSRINSVWARGVTNTLELVRVVCAARRALPRGQWAQLWKSDRMPFAQRKGEMLVAIGKRLDWINPQTFARLPCRWSILYQLSRLEKATLLALIARGTIHPRLTCRAAQELVASFRCQSVATKASRNSLLLRLRKFQAFITENAQTWSPAECELVHASLARCAQALPPPGEDSGRAMVRMPRRAVPARVAAGGTNNRTPPFILTQPNPHLDLHSYENHSA